MKLYWEDFVSDLDGTVGKALNEYWVELEKPTEPRVRALQRAMLDEIHRDLKGIADRIRDYGKRIRTGNI